LTRAGRFTIQVDSAPSTQNDVECYGRHAVVWLPGDYRLGATLTIPPAADAAIHAEGTYFHYDQPDGDAIVITGMNRCRYAFGTIDSQSGGAALAIRPTPAMPALMSVVTYMGLVGHGQQGTGLLLDPIDENVCTNRFDGTDIRGFDTGILVRAAGRPKPPSRPTGKCDTNWFWVSYVRVCRVCIREEGGGVDDNVWNVNVDACLPDSVAVRTAAEHGRWYVIMGALQVDGVNRATALLLDPGARDNVIEVHPPVENYAWEDRSGNDSNVILTTRRPPYRR